MTDYLEKDTGRQDIRAPEPTLEKSDPTPVDVKRGQRLWLGITLVSLIFLLIIAVVMVATR